MIVQPGCCALLILQSCAGLYCQSLDSAVHGQVMFGIYITVYTLSVHFPFSRLMRIIFPTISSYVWYIPTQVYGACVLIRSTPESITARCSNITLPYLACAPRDSPMYPTLEESSGRNKRRCVNLWFNLWKKKKKDENIVHCCGAMRCVRRIQLARAKVPVQRRKHHGCS